MRDRPASPAARHGARESRGRPPARAASRATKAPSTRDLDPASLGHRLDYRSRRSVILKGILSPEDAALAGSTAPTGFSCRTAARNLDTARHHRPAPGCRRGGRRADPASSWTALQRTDGRGSAWRPRRLIGRPSGAVGRRRRRRAHDADPARRVSVGDGAVRAPRWPRRSRVLTGSSARAGTVDCRLLKGQRDGGRSAI